MKDDLLMRVLGTIRTFKDDQEKLARLLLFIEEELYEEEEEEEIELPAKYDSLVHEMTQYIKDGMFLNPQTLEVFFLLDDDFEMMTGSSPEDLGIDLDVCIRIEKLSSNDQYAIMEGFVASLPKRSSDKARLEQAITGKKPFANFNRLIHNSDVREEWFEFQFAKHKEHAKQIVFDLLDQLEDNTSENI